MSQSPRNCTTATPGAPPWGLVLQPTPALPHVHAGRSPQMLPVGARAPIPSIQSAMAGAQPYTAGPVQPTYPIPIPKTPAPPRVNSGGHFEERWDPAMHGQHPQPGAGTFIAAGLAARNTSTSTKPSAPQQPANKKFFICNSDSSAASSVVSSPS